MLPHSEPPCHPGRVLLRAICAWLALSACTAAAADDPEIGRLLKEKGVQVTESTGVVTGLNIPDGKKLTGEDLAQIGRLSQLKMLSLSDGLDDERLARLAMLPQL